MQKTRWKYIKYYVRDNKVRGTSGIAKEVFLIVKIKKHHTIVSNYSYIQKALTAVCGKSDCLYTPFVTRTFHYILGICYHIYTLFYLVYHYLSFIKCIFMS